MPKTESKTHLKTQASQRKTQASSVRMRSHSHRPGSEAAAAAAPLTEQKHASGAYRNDPAKKRQNLLADPGGNLPQLQEDQAVTTGALISLLARFPLPEPGEGPGQRRQILQQLRRENTPASLLAALATQWELRDLLAKKLSGSDPRDFLLTRTGVEQASREIVARLHASYFQNYLRDRETTATAPNSGENPAGTSAPTEESLSSELPNAIGAAPTLVDLGCGLGFESAALAQANPGTKLVAYEIDPLTAEYAQANLEKYSQVEVCLADGTQRDYQNCLLFCDPARRKNGKRIYDPQQWSPALGTVLSLGEQALGVGIKLAPGIDYADIPATMHAQWVSVDGELVEASLWSPHVYGRVPGRSASLLKTIPAALLAEENHTYRLAACLTLEEKTLAGDDSHSYRQWTLSQNTNPQLPPEPMPSLESPGKHLYELDSALVRAGLLEPVARLYALAPLSPGIAYLSETTSESLALKAAEPETARALVRLQLDAIKIWEIQEILPLKAKAVSRCLAARNITHVEIKKRGVDLDPQQWRNKVLPAKQVKQALKNRRAAGKSPKQGATIFLTRCGGKHVAILATEKAEAKVEAKAEAKVEAKAEAKAAEKVEAKAAEKVEAKTS